MKKLLNIHDNLKQMSNYVFINLIDIIKEQ